MDLRGRLPNLNVREDWRAWVVAGACTYEVFSLATGKVPPLTHIAWKARTHKIYRFVLWLVLGWFIEHIFGEGRSK